MNEIKQKAKTSILKRFLQGGAEDEL